MAIHEEASLAENEEVPEKERHTPGLHPLHENPQKPVNLDQTDDRPEYSHLHREVVPMLDYPDHQRVRICLSDLWIGYPAFNGMINELQWLIEEPHRMRSKGLIYVSDNGNGKTAIGKYLKWYYPDSYQKDAIRVIRIQASGVRTAKCLQSRVMRGARVPIVGGSYDDKQQVVDDTLRGMNCRLLVIDEVQDFLHLNRAEKLRVFEFIKEVMTDHKVPVLGLGTLDACDAFTVDKHLRARFAVAQIPPWEEGPVLARFLSALESHLPLRHRSDLARPEIQKVLLKAGKGSLDPMMERIRDAAVWAIADGTEQIDIRRLEGPQLKPPIGLLRGTGARH